MQSHQITTCLWFNGNAEEAVAFYRSVFPDSSTDEITRYPIDSPPGQGNARTGDVLTIAFTLNGHKFVALNGGANFPFTFAVSFQVPCETQAEIDDYWAKFGDGGKEVECGWITDKYGLAWQVFPRILPELLAGPDTAKAARVMQAMMTMKKIDLAAIQKAANG